MNPRLSAPLTTLAVAAGATTLLTLATLPPPPAQAAGARAMSVGGQTVPMGTFPWAVALEKRQPGTGVAERFCSGALISDRYVLTAGHCSELEGLDSPADVRREGLAVRFANLDGQPAIAARRMTIPGSYWVGMWGRRQQSDIALVELASPAPTAPTTVSRAVPGEGSPVTALGYGTTPTSRVLSDSLMQTWTLAAAPGRCGGPAPGGFTVTAFPQTDICTAAGPSDTTPPLDGATCGGDSGGPLLGGDLAGVVGVTSWGRLNACRVEANLRSSVFAKPGSVGGWLKRQTGVGLFGEPPVAVDHAGPVNATLTRGPLTGREVAVRVGARGSNWRAIVFVQFARESSSGPALQTVALSLGPQRRSGTVRAPSAWGARPQGLQVLDVAARVWRPDNLNGVTRHAE